MSTLRFCIYTEVCTEYLERSGAIKIYGYDLLGDPANNQDVLAFIHFTMSSGEPLGSSLVARILNYLPSISSH
jgi:hypothetical protein